MKCPFCGHDTLSTALFQTPYGFLTYSLAVMDKIKELHDIQVLLKNNPDPAIYLKARELLEWFDNRLKEVQQAEKEFLAQKGR